MAIRSVLVLNKCKEIARLIRSGYRDFYYTNLIFPQYKYIHYSGNESRIRYCMLLMLP